MPSTVILGTGIIGLSTAYYLSQLAEAGADESYSDTTPTAHNPSDTAEKHEIHLVEPAPELFASASGKAAGFLAKDWFAPAVAPLGEFSFGLHRRLAEEHGGAERWGWSESVSYSLDRDDDGGSAESSESESDDEDDDVDEMAPGPSERPARERKKTRNDLDWLMSGSSRATLLDTQRTEAASEAAAAGEHGGPVGASPDEEDEEHPRWVRASQNSMQMISDRHSTGQVDPYRLCQFLLQECLARGVQLHQPARATQLLTETMPDSSERTLVRLEYLDSDPEAVFAAAGAPNSKSPAPNGHADSSSSARLNGYARSSSAETSHDNRQPFSSPPETGGSSANASAAEEDYISYGNGHETDSSASGEPTSSGTRTLDVPCDSLVIAAGCWTPGVYRTLFPNAGRIPSVTALAGHSVVLKSRKWMSSKSRRKLQAKLAADALGDVPHVGVPLTPSPSAESSTSTSSTASTSTTGRVSPASSFFSRSSSYSSATTGSPGTSPSALPQPPYPGVTHAVFTSDRARYSPEIFSRLSGDVWLGGLNSSAIPLPPLPTMARVDPAAIDKLMHTAEALLGSVSALPADRDGGRRRRPSLTLLRSALCFRPVTPTGRPVIARMHEADLGDGVRVPGGVFVATGHGPWGISLALGTGWIVGEMVLGRAPSVDVATLGKWEAGAP